MIDIYMIKRTKKDVFIHIQLYSFFFNILYLKSFLYFYNDWLTFTARRNAEGFVLITITLTI